MVTLQDFNPFSGVGISSIGLALLIFFIAILFLAFVGAGVWWWIRRKQLKYTIPLLKNVGGKPMKVGLYKAMDFKISMAGDKLWYVPKAKKYIPVGTLQTAPNEYTHFEREDGEWINIDYPDIDDKMKKAGVRYVHQDMRSQRIAISNILEARFKEKKGFWEQYGHLITHLIFYLVVMVAMVIIFYQWSVILDKTTLLFDRIVAYEDKLKETSGGLVPVASMIPILGKRWIK